MASRGGADFAPRQAALDVGTVRRGDCRYRLVPANLVLPRPRDAASEVAIVSGRYGATRCMSGPKAHKVGRSSTAPSFGVIRDAVHRDDSPCDALYERRR